MSNNVVPFRQGGMPAAFANRALPDMNAAAKQGLTPSFAVIGYKGRNWRLKYSGEDEMLKEPNGAPTPTLDVVIIGISAAISKIFYDKKYSEGDDQAPDCWSTDGFKPDNSAPKKQNDLCATCPKNAWGSRVTDAGKKAKACQDSRRLVVVPADDIENEGYGGPMLLRLPPMSLSNLAAYTRELEKHGAQPYMVRTVLGFNYDVAYPEITFQTTGWLDDATGGEVAKMLEDARVPTILAESHITGDEGTIQTPTAGDMRSHAADVLAGKDRASTPIPTPQQVTPEPQAHLAKTAAEIEAEELAEFRAAKARNAAATQAAPSTAAPMTEAEKAVVNRGLVTAGQPPVAGIADVVPPKKAPFGKKTSPATKGAAVADHMVNEAPVTVKPAPDDIEAAIDALL